MGLHQPTLQQVTADKESRSRIREDARRRALNSGSPAHRDAAIMAANGWGVDDIAVTTGITRWEARQMVLGVS